MSSSAKESLVAAYGLGISDTYVLTALAALVAFEHIITFDREVAVIWRRKFTGATVVFMLNRYCLLAYVILTIAPVYNKFECAVSIRLEEAIEVIQFTTFASFSALRIYALWNCNLALSVLVFVLDFVPVTVNLVYYAGTAIVFGFDPIIGPSCSGQSTGRMSHEVDFRLALATRIALILANLLMLVLTWAKTFRLKREAMRLNMKMPLSTLLLRDGTIYFFVLTTMSIVNILVLTVPSFVVIAPISWFFNIITGILVSRFILNLRQIAEANDGAETDKFSQFSFPEFRAASSAFAGNLGEQLAAFSSATDNIDSRYHTDESDEMYQDA